MRLISRLYHGLEVIRNNNSQDIDTRDGVKISNWKAKFNIWKRFFLVYMLLNQDWRFSDRLD